MMCQKSTMEKEYLIRLILGSCEMEQLFYYEIIPEGVSDCTLTFMGYRPFDDEASPYQAEYLFLGSNIGGVHKLRAHALENLDLARKEIESFLKPFSDTYQLCKQS